MKRSLLFYSRAVWPPALLVWLFIFSYGLLAGSLWLIELPLRQRGGMVLDTPEILNLRAGILEGAAALYALFRLWRFHPVCNQAYAAWLKSSPWAPDRPLPLGPVHPVWQDAIVIAVLTAIAFWHAHVNAALPAVVYFFSYLFGMTVLLAFARQWWACLALGFLWPGLLLPGTEELPMVFLIGAIIVVIYFGYRQSLKAFPWNFLRNTDQPASSLLQMEIRIDSQKIPGAQTSLGWPFVALSPKIQPAAVSHLTSVCLSALFGWWSFCFIECAKPDPLPELMVAFAIIAAIIRLATYSSGTTPPFNLWGRLARGRIVVTGFDKIFLTPLLVVAVGILGGMLIQRSGNWVPVTESAVFALIWYVLFAGGPSLRNWILTGQHGFRPPARANANRQALRPV